MTAVMQLNGIDAVISSAVHCGYDCDLGRQRLFDLGMLVEDDATVQHEFKANLAIVLRCPGENADLFAIMGETLSTFFPGDLILLRRRIARAHPTPEAAPYRNRFRPGLTWLE